MPSWLPILGWRDLVDIAVVAVFAWAAIRYFRRTRARAAVAGLAFLGLVYLAARALELRLTEAIFQGFFAVLVLVLVVIFQEDLRRAFEQLGTWRQGRPPRSPESEVLDVLVRTVSRLAATRTGALIVLPGREPLDRHLEGGITLGGRVSEPLLLSLFDASSPGHDGAVVLRGSVVERFATHLPLSSNHEALGPGGTRHAAGLGLAESSDAACIIVSEERGTVSLAKDGAIRVLGRPEDLLPELRLATPEPEQKRRWFGRVGLEGVVAAAVSVALWTVVVPGSDVSEVTVEVPVELTNLPLNLDLEQVEPDAVEVTLRGLRRDLVLVEPKELAVRVDAQLARLGRRTFQISAEDVRTPGVLSVVTIAPEQIKLSLKPAETSGPDSS